MLAGALTARRGGDVRGIALLACLAAVAAGGAVGAGIHPLIVAGLPAAGVLVVLAVATGREPLLLVAGVGILLPSTQASRWLGLWGVLAITILAVALRDPRGMRPQRELRPVLALSGALALWLMLSALVAGDGGAAGLVLSLTLVMACLTIAGARLAEHRGLGVAADAFIALSAVGGLVLMLRLGAGAGGLSGGDYAAAKDAVFAEVGDANGQAFIVMPGLPLGVAAMLAARGRGGVLLGAAGVVLGGVGLLLLLSRSAILGALVGCAVVGLLLVRLSLRRVLAFGAGAAVLAMLLLPGLGRIGSDRQNLDSRQDLWRVAVDFIRERPILGHGPDAWASLVTSRARLGPDGAAGGAHNILLSGGVSGGVVAMLIQVALAAIVLVMGVRAFHRLRAAGLAAEAGVAAGAVGALVAVLVRGQFEATGWPGTRVFDLRTWTAVLSWSLVALIAASARRARFAPERGPGAAGG